MTNGYYWIEYDDGEEGWSTYKSLIKAREDARDSIRLHHTGDYAYIWFRPISGRSKKVGIVEYLPGCKAWSTDGKTYYRLYEDGRIGGKVKVDAWYSTQF